MVVFTLFCALSFWVCIAVNLLMFGHTGVWGALAATFITFIVGASYIVWTKHQGDHADDL